MKRSLYAAMVAAIFIGLASCNPDEPDKPVPVDPVDPVPVDPVNPQPQFTDVTATATLQDFPGFSMVWSKGDSFIVGYSDGSTAQTASFSLTEGDNSVSGKFVSSSTVADTAPAYAFFPPSIVKSTGGTASDCTLNWPFEQKSGIPQACDMPMQAVTTGLSSLNGPYSFKSLGGIIHVKATGTGTINKAVLMTKQPIAGEFKTDSYGYLSFENGSKSVYNNITIACNTSVDLSKGTEFYFVVPEGVYTEVAVSFEGDGYSYKASIEDVISVTRNEVTGIDISGVKGYGAGKLLKVDAEHDITYDNIMASLTDMVPQIKAFSGMLDLVIKPFIANHTHIARIIYLTPDRDGELVEASGLVAYQYYSKLNDCSYDRIVSVQHGTCDIADAPSYQNFYPEIASAAIKGNPYIVVMADYLGYGASQTPDLQHPYLSKELTGSCCADMLLAAEEYISATGLDLASDRLDLVGYSQGGAATMATLLELEKRGGYDDRITEVHAGAGPYDILGFFDCFKNKETYDKTGFVPYTFRGICYGEHLTVDYNNIFNPALTEKTDLETLFSTKQVNEWHSVLGYSIKDILHPDFYKDNYGGNADILALVAALDKNSIVNFKAPKNLDKVKFYHSVTDDTVPYSCSEALQEAWGFQEIIKLQAQHNHLLGGVEFLLNYSGLENLAAIIIPLIK